VAAIALLVSLLLLPTGKSKKLDDVENGEFLQIFESGLTKFRRKSADADNTVMLSPYNHAILFLIILLHAHIDSANGMRIRLHISNREIDFG
jgi:hypothetical protein